MRVGEIGWNRNTEHIFPGESTGSGDWIDGGSERERCHWQFPGCYHREFSAKVMSLYWNGQLGGGCLGRGA